MSAFRCTGDPCLTISLCASRSKHLATPVNASIRNRLSFPSRPVRNRCCSVVTNHDFQKCPSLKGTSVIATINCGDFVDCENPTARMGGVSGLRGNMHATNMGRRKCCYSQNFEPFVDCALRRSAI